MYGRLLAVLIASAMLGGCLGSSTSAARRPTLRPSEPLAACLAPLTPPVPIPPSEPDLRPAPGGYFVTDAQMAAIEAQFSSCRFQRTELLAHRSAACGYIGERAAAVAEYQGAARKALDDERAACAQERLRILMLAGGGTAAGIALGALGMALVAF